MNKFKLKPFFVCTLVIIAILATTVWLALKQRETALFPRISKDLDGRFISVPSEGLRKPVKLDDASPSVSAIHPTFGDTSSAEAGILSLQLRNNLIIALASGNFAAITETISNALKTTAGVEMVKNFLRDKTISLEVRKLTAEALIRVGTEDSSQIVATAATWEFEIGEPHEGSTILSALRMSAGFESAKGLLNVLLKNKNSDGISYPLPFEVQSVLRKTLRNASDAEQVGRLMALRYSELLDSGQEIYANELLIGVAHPAMLSELLVQAHAQGEADEVTGLFDRLIATDDPGAVGALARLASKEPFFLNRASEALFNWSFDHSDHLQPGLFAEYMNDRALPPQQRVVAAYGLAGLLGKDEARRTLEKAILSETDHYSRECLKNALTSFQNASDPDNYQTDK